MGEDGGSGLAPSTRHGGDKLATPAMAVRYPTLINYENRNA
jgi:hypothetical protein